MLLVAYLRRADVRGRPLRAGERALLGPDDPALRQPRRRRRPRACRPAALSALARRARHAHFLPHPVWGGSTVTAADQARFFLRIDRLVPRRHRAYAMGLLRGVVAGQRWGIPAALPAGWRIAFKGGWGKGVTRQVDHQAALLTNAGLRVSIAVLTADNPSDAYGAATIAGRRGAAAARARGDREGKLVRTRRAWAGCEPSARSAEHRRQQQHGDDDREGHHERGDSLSSMHRRRSDRAHSPAIAGNMSHGDTHRILLFDIDGTLVSTGGAGAVAWRRAFEDLHGIPADIGQFTDAGMTDPDVGAKTFEAVIGRKPSPHELALLVQRRLEYLPEAVAESEGYKVLPGVPSGCASSAARGTCSG